MLNTLGYLLVALAVQASARTWTDIHGRTAKAEFVRVYQGNVILLRENRVVKVPLGNLCQQDQEYVTQQMAAKGQPHRALDRQRLVSAPTVPELPQQSSQLVAEAPAPPSLADHGNTDSDFSARSSLSHAPRLSPPTPASNRGTAASKAPPTTPQRLGFGRLTVEEANRLIVDRLFQETGRRGVARQKSASPADWPDARQLVRVEQANVPILDAPDLTARRLNILGVADVGEVLALVEKKTVVALINPLGNAPDQSGTWYKVQMLDGKQGWIFAEPQGHQGPPIARVLVAQRSGSWAPTEIQINQFPTSSDMKPLEHASVPTLGEALVKPLNDPQLSAAQRLARGIGMVIGGGLAVLVLIGSFGVLLLAAGGWRRWQWRERLRRMRESGLFARL